MGHFGKKIDDEPSFLEIMIRIEVQVLRVS